MIFTLTLSAINQQTQQCDHYDIVYLVGCDKALNNTGRFAGNYYGHLARHSWVLDENGGPPKTETCCYLQDTYMASVYTSGGYYGLITVVAIFGILFEEVCFKFAEMSCGPIQNLSMFAGI